MGLNSNVSTVPLILRCAASTASLVSPWVPAARRLFSSSSLTQIAQNGEPIGLLLEEDLVKTPCSLFFFCCFFNQSTFCLLYLPVRLWWNTALWCSNVVLKSCDPLLDRINEWWLQLMSTFSLSMSYIVFKLPTKISRSFPKPHNLPKSGSFLCRTKHRFQSIFLIISSDVHFIFFIA